MVRGSNPGGGEIFCTCPDRPGAQPASCTIGTGSFPGGKERPGRDTDPSLPSIAVGHERVEPYLYSPYGLYGLYRASVPVQACTLPFTFFRECVLFIYIYFIIKRLSVFSYHRPSHFLSVRMNCCKPQHLFQLH